MSSSSTIRERIDEFRAKRGTLVDQKQALIQKAVIDEGRTLDEAETEQSTNIAADISSIDKTLEQLTAHEALMIQKAVPIMPQTGAAPGAGAVAIGSGVISVRRNLPPGTAFTRYAMALAASKGNLMQAEVIANNLWGDSTPEVGQVLKTAVASGTTSDSTWAGPLVQYQDMAGEFIEFLRPQTILGRLSLRRVPFNVRIPRQTAGITGSFVGEGLPAPVNKLTFDNVTLPWSKASTIVVLTMELARLSQPSAEALVRADLAAGIAQYLDKRLVDPAYPGVTSVSPASLTNGVTPTQATGATLAALDADVRTVMTTFANANQGLQAGVWVMSAALAIRLSMLRTNQDTMAFPGLTVNGGTFYGLPALVSNNVTGSGSPGDQFLILIDQNEVFLADDGGISIEVSSEASIQLEDAPSAGAQSLVSLWQNGLLGVKVDRWIHWVKRRSTAVAFIDAAQRYGS